MHIDGNFQTAFTNQHVSWFTALTHPKPLHKCGKCYGILVWTIHLWPGPGPTARALSRNVGEGVWGPRSSGPLARGQKFEVKFFHQTFLGSGGAGNNMLDKRIANSTQAKWYIHNPYLDYIGQTDNCIVLVHWYIGFYISIPCMQVCNLHHIQVPQNLPSFLSQWHAMRLKIQMTNCLIFSLVIDQFLSYK